MSTRNPYTIVLRITDSDGDPVAVNVEVLEVSRNSHKVAKAILDNYTRGGVQTVQF